MTTPPSQTPPSLVDIENVVTLVGHDDITHKIILSDLSKGRFERGEETILEVKSHDGMALGYFQSSQLRWGDAVQFLTGLIKKESDGCIIWKYVDKN